MTQYKDVLQLVYDIQASRLGSIGSINNVYLPQLDREAIDALAAALASQGESDALVTCMKARIDGLKTLAARDLEVKALRVLLQRVLDYDPWYSDEYGERCFFCSVEKDYEYGGTGPLDFKDHTVHTEECTYMMIRVALGVKGETK